ncbi:MAG: glycoside hydrolase family 3 C-terminal domain-containing protein [Bacteroidales bacterium]|nr:glycoside hydrolase family 3 C-terminal domain-containing protein [Bacteroidales bacterium]
MRIKLIAVIGIAALCLSACGGSSSDPSMLPYQNPKLSASQRAEDLLSRLSLEQKVSLMVYQSKAIDEFGIKEYNWWNEALHGAARAGLATVFPQTIGMAASFDDALVNQVFDVASTEQRIKFIQERQEKGKSSQYHGLTVWTPNINIFRDPRWGRGQETYGEDPFLTAKMGYAVVNGLQGPVGSKYNKLHACLKHFAVHSGPESERHRFSADDVSARDLQETYLYAFEKLVRTTDVKEVMCAYNSIDGDPCCTNDKLLTKILREDWGYKGIVVSDCWAINDVFMPNAHNVYPNDIPTAVSDAVLSGTDLECGQSYSNLIKGVENGTIKESDIDVSVKRLLKARFELGEMDPDETVSWNQIDVKKLASDEHDALALKMARESMVLLQNNNNVLPLKKSGLKVAVLGPNAADSVVLAGNYNGTPRKSVTVLEAIQKMVGAENVVYAKGCNIAKLDLNSIPQRLSNTLGNAHDAGLLARMGVMEKNDEIPEADVYIFVGGISPRLEGEEMRVNYEGFMGGDRTSIELPETQREYLAELHQTGKPVVFVSMSGSALALSPETQSCDAILQAWYAGQEGGQAIAEVLFGDYNPAGRLPVTFYASDDQLGDFHDYNMAGHTYRYFSGKPLYSFGYGLSYTTFTYGAAKVSSSKVIIPINNTGSKDGDEVVQIYIRRDADVDGPKMALRGFQRVSVKAGTGANVEIEFDEDTFKTFNEATGKMQVVSGTHTLYYGPSSDNLQSISVSVKAKSNGKYTVKAI